MGPQVPGHKRRILSSFERGRVCIRTILASERWPIVADLVEDRVASRLVTVLLFVCVFTFVLRALYVVFLNTPASLPQAAPLSLRYVGDAAGQSAATGAALSPVFTLLLSRADVGVGIAGTPVAVNVTLGGADSLAWQLRFGFRGTVIDYTGLPIDGRYSLPGFVPSAFLAPVVSGANVSTDANGFARMWDLSVELGLPGRYLVSAAASGIQIDANRFDLVSRVGSVVLPAEPPLTRASPKTALGSVLPPLRAQVLDLRCELSPRPLRIKTVAALTPEISRTPPTPHTTPRPAAEIPSPACAAFSIPRRRPSLSTRPSRRGLTRLSLALPS